MTWIREWRCRWAIAAIAVVLSLSALSPGHAFAFEYGRPGASANAAGRLTRRTDSSGTIAFQYGAMGETTRIDRTLVATLAGTHSVSATTLFVHDSFGRMLSMRYPDGEEVHYSYNLGGQLESVDSTGPGASLGTNYVSSIRYDEFGSRIRMTAGNGVVTRYQYDPVMRRLAQLDSTMPTGAAMQALRYAYNLVGNISSMQNRGVTQTYTYDRLDQLTSAIGLSTRPLGAGPRAPIATQRYVQALGYDEIGNLRRNVQFDAIQIESAPARIRPDTSHDLIYTYDASRPHAPRCVGNRLVDYDLDGNQRHWEHRPDTCPGTERPDGERTNVWDEEDRLTRLTDDNADMEFRYDADGERTHRISMGHGRHDVTAYVSRFHSVRNEQFAMNHVFAGSERVATVMFNLPPTGPCVDGMLAGSGRFCTVTSGGPSTLPPTAGGPRTTLWYHTDHLQSTNYVTDARGRFTEHLEYFPFGEQWVEEQSGASSDTVPYRFTGHDWDSETRLYYAGARYYDPRQGQWLSGDPAGRGRLSGAQSTAALGLYSYSRNSPLVLRDPNGADPVSCLAPGACTPAAAANTRIVRPTFQPIEADVAVVPEPGDVRGWEAHFRAEAAERRAEEAAHPRPRGLIDTLLPDDLQGELLAAGLMVFGGARSGGGSAQARVARPTERIGPALDEGGFAPPAGGPPAPTSRPTFSNLGDPSRGRVVGAVAREGDAYRLAAGGEIDPGRYDFVVQGGELRIGSGHYALSGGRPVEFAGEIAFGPGGRVAEWTNASGHFRPAAAFAANAGLPMSAFRPVQFPAMVGGPQLPVHR